MELKAYRAWIGDGEWVLLVYAPDRNHARKMILDFGGTVDDEYIHTRARRAPRYDRYAQGEKPYEIGTNSDLP